MELRAKIRAPPLTGPKAPPRLRPGADGGECVIPECGPHDLEPPTTLPAGSHPG